MWAGIWSRALRNAWNLHAKIMDNLIIRLLFHTPALRLRDTDPKTPRSEGRHSETRWKILHPSHPPNVFPSHQFPHPEVPPSPEQGKKSGQVYDLNFHLAFSTFLHP